MNVLYNTKIEVKKFDDDSYLNTTRQIALINCKKYVYIFLKLKRMYFVYNFHKVYLNIIEFVYSYIFFILTMLFFHRLSCTLLTTNLKNVAAGSLDSLIYLWERTKFDLNNLLNSPLDKSNNFIE